MKLTVENLKLIKKQCENIGLINGQSYLAIAPDSAKYPFLTFTPISMTPDWSFDKNYEYQRIQFSIFDNKTNKNNVVAIMKDIENIFHRTKIQFEHKEEGRYLIFSHKDTERIQWMLKDKYWMGTTDYIFVSQMNAQEVEWSSSSSSSESSSSTEFILHSSSSSSDSSSLSSVSSSSSDFFGSSSSSSSSLSSQSSSSYSSASSDSSDSSASSQSSSSYSSDSSESSNSSQSLSSQSSSSYSSDSSDSSVSSDSSISSQSLSSDSSNSSGSSDSSSSYSSDSSDSSDSSTSLSSDSSVSSDSSNSSISDISSQSSDSSDSSQSLSSDSSVSSNSSSSSLEYSSSSSSSYDCPNIITSLTATIDTSKTFTPSSLINVNINSVDTKDRYLQLFTANVDGDTYDTNRVIWGNTDGSSTVTSDGFISIIVNSSTYYIRKYLGDVKVDCCSSINGIDTATGTFTSYGFVLVLINGTDERYLELYTIS